MNEQKFQQVELPDELEMEQHIRSIVAAGLVPKQTFYHYLRTMYRRLGFRHLFHDWTEIVFALTAGFALIIWFALTAFERTRVLSEDLYSAIFIGSPVLYLVIALLFFFRRKYSDTYETEMTCKYNVYQLASLRMLVFSLACMVVNAVLIVAAAIIYSQLNVLFAISLSAASLFLFSAAFLYIMVSVHSDMMKYVLIAGWFILNLTLLQLNKEFYLHFISAIPISIYIAVAIFGCAISLKNLKKLTTFQSSEGAL
ncbi:hypothetical protein AB4Z45_21730 [Paenibacillus sp. MCAF9]|uniref:hypothetical protein n=1 Tax=Paenibacillus sp. MCAF9 TaxID=3233046 RepID=UPI003F95F4BA